MKEIIIRQYEFSDFSIETLDDIRDKSWVEVEIDGQVCDHLQSVPVEAKMPTVRDYLADADVGIVVNYMKRY